MRIQKSITQCACFAALVLAAQAAGKSGTPPANLGVSGQAIVVVQPDPARPGKTLWKLRAKSVSAAQQNQAFQATLLSVTATLFQKGVAAATLSAPTAQGDSARKTLVASGRVTIRSLAQPGTTLQADTVTWQASVNKIVARGHVVYKNGKTGLTVASPILVADTALKTLRSSGGGQAVLPKGLR